MTLIEMGRHNQDSIRLAIQDDDAEMDNLNSGCCATSHHCRRDCCCTHFQVPLTGILIQIALGVCCILEWGVWEWDEISNTEIRFNAFGASWFNCAGVLLHYLPNVILAFFCGWLIEWNVGSLNMIFVWFWAHFPKCIDALDNARA